MDSLPEIERTTTIPAPSEEIWDDIVDGSLTGEWLGIRIDPRVGGSVTDDERTMIGVVEDIDEGTSITWAWRPIEGEPSQVTISLEPVDDEATLVRVVERMLPYEITYFPPTFSASLAA